MSNFQNVRLGVWRPCIVSYLFGQKEDANGYNAKEKEVTNTLFFNNQSINQSFDETLGKIKAQIEIDSIPVELLLQAEELAVIIAEVMRLRQSDALKVGGVIRPVGDVQAVFAKIENEHIVYVLEHYNEVPYRIRNPKQYLRTALYNSVFEINNAAANLYSATEGGRP